MIRSVWATSIALTIFFDGCLLAQGGRLQSVREDVRTSPAADSTSNSSSGIQAQSDDSSWLTDSDASSNGSDDGSGLSLGLPLLTILAPFYLPAAILGDGYDYRLHFTRHPYSAGYQGYQIASADVASSIYQTTLDEVPRKDWAVRVAIESGSDFNGLDRLGGQAKVEHASRFGIATNWHYFRERLPCGCIDEVLIGDTNLTFRFAQNEVASMYTGLGFRTLSDRRHTDFGFNFTYGGDWFPVRPLVVSGVIDAGTLGYAGVFHARGTVGATWRGIEIYGGYDFLRIGNTNLQGPMIGMRLWF